MGFILDGLDTEAYDRTYGDRELLNRIISYFRPHRRKMILVAVTLTLNSVAGTGGPILISEGIDLMAEGEQRLKGDHRLVVLDEVAHQHENLLVCHHGAFVAMGRVTRPPA